MVNNQSIYTVTHENKDPALMDNWVSLHYIGSQNYEQERILWRKTLLQWQTFWVSETQFYKKGYYSDYITNENVLELLQKKH